MTTPICDLIESLLSRGTSPQEALETARQIEGPMTEANAIARGSFMARRDRERLKKQRSRARKSENVPGDADQTPILSNTQNSLSNLRKKEPRSSPVPGDKIIPSDDWPEDYVDQFWKAFPPFRRQAKAKVAAKLSRIRADKKTTWVQLYDGCVRFAATNPGEYAPAPMVWLNDGRWDREYGPQGGSNAKTQNSGRGGVGFAGLAGRLRHGAESGGDQLPFGQPPGDQGPHGRR